MLLAANKNAVETTKMILGQGASAMGALQSVGVGIASVIILFVIFKDVTAILDGGKFQAKMLLPLLIYLMVCNFNLVQKPVISFTSTLQSASVGACKGMKQSYLNSMTDGSYGADGCPNIMTAYVYKQNKLHQQGPKVTVKENDEDPKDTEGLDEGEKNKRRSWMKGIGATLSKWWKTNFTDKLWNGWGVDTKDIDSEVLRKVGITALLAAILSWVVNAFSIVLSIFGSVMTGIIVAFGPITFAFAVFPGNGKAIGSWIIRLCQYALYAPIAALVDSFSVVILGETIGLGADGTLMLVAVLICNLVALTAVPSIASSIIEGASGAVSLSSGLQSIGAALTAAGSVVAAPHNIVKGGMNQFDLLQRLGEGKRDNKEITALQNIEKMMEGQMGGGGSVDTAPHGQQPNRGGGGAGNGFSPSSAGGNVSWGQNNGGGGKKK